MGNNVYQIITNRILELLDKGKIPWQKPWKGGAKRCPMNFISKKKYRGINVFTLAYAQQERGYTSNKWLTFKQVSELGGSVRKGERAELVIFFTFKEKEQEESDKTEVIPILRYYNVFNLCQCEGIELPEEDRIEPIIDFNPIEKAEEIVNNMPLKPEILFKGQSAYYNPALDFINMPNPETFYKQEEFYSTLFHELIHSTGHPSRLDRNFLKKKAAFGSEEYSREELIAEFGSAMLCGIAGIEKSVIENQAAYIKGWKKAIKEDPRALVLAANKAQRAADFILGEEFSVINGD